VAGQSLPYDGPLRGPVEIVLRSSDLVLASAGEAAAGPALPGRVEERLFLGTHYRHYVRVGAAVVMVDASEPVPDGAVSVIIPPDALRVFAVA